MDIVIKNISKSFVEKKVLCNFNTIFKDEQVNCIMGESGCGKTTLLNIMLGLIKKDSGDIKGLEDKKISTVFQEDRLCEGFTVYENIKLVCLKEISKKQIEENLSSVGIADVIDKKVSTLSGGMKRRVSIVRAVAAESNLLIMDEPFKGLDDKTKVKVIEYVKEKTKGKTLIVTTHDKEEALLMDANIINM